MSDNLSRSQTNGEKLAESTKQFLLIIIHLCISVFAFVAAAVFYVEFLQGQSPFYIRPEQEHVSPDYYTISIINLIVGVLVSYLPLVISIWVGLKFAARANALMRAAFYEQTSVVPQKDFDLVQAAIQKGDPGPITEYIRLVSLTGGAGIFQKIGLTGLPLVTLGLVIFFAVGVLFCDSGTETFKAFLDFTKLTLGAFIGSFVQRQVENRSRETELQRAVENIARGGTSASRLPPSPGVGPRPAAVTETPITGAPDPVAQGL